MQVEIQMLLNDFYGIIEEVRSDEVISEGISEHLYFRIGIKAGHKIFEGHFPGNPVVPGVVQIEMIRELLGKTYNKEFILSGSDSIKFLSVITPATHPVIDMKLDVKVRTDGSTNVTGTIFSNELVFLKFRGTFKPE